MTSYRLVVEKGRSKGRTLRLKPNGTVVVGRDQGNQLVISDVQASRRHFQIVAKLGEFQLEDLGSSNGTVVNGERVEKVVLAPGDKVQVGETLVYFLDVKVDDGEERRGDLSGREICGYRIGRLLGRGGMGTVYEAVQISLERKVAFKVLAPELAGNPEFIERFISEARAAGRLSHANIVAVYDVGQQEQLRFFSMEYMDGGSVEDLLRKEGRLSVARTIPIVFDAARGLEFAEKHGVIHRDIKPDNLMLGTDDVVKICDLGIATYYDPGGQEQISGSPQYLAPEHAQGKLIDHRVDLYSLGVSWYQMLAGETPFAAASAKEVILKHINEEPPPLREKAPDVGEDVAALVAKLMAKDPEQRVASARQLQADLAELARRYTLRDTVLLRLDALAPQQAPSPELTPSTTDPTEASGQALPRLALPKNLVWLLLGLVAVGLLVGGYLVTSSIVAEDEEVRLNSAQEDLRVVRELLAEERLEEASKLARIAAQRLRADGLDELAADAERIAVEAERRVVEEREDSARTELRKIRGLAQSYVPGPQALDPESASRLEDIIRSLDALAGDYPDTESAGEATDLARQLNAQLERIRVDQAAVAERHEIARRELERAKGRVEDLISDRRFADAGDRARKFLAEHGEVEPVGAQRLLEQVGSEASGAVETQLKVSLQLQSQADWDGARTALELLQGSLGDPALEGSLSEALVELEENREGFQRAEEAARIRKDQRLLEDLRRTVAEDLRARRYGAVVDQLRLERQIFEVVEIQRRFDVWLERLEGAERAVVTFLRALEEEALTVTLEVEFVAGRGKQRASVFEVDRAARMVTFEGPVKGVLKDIELSDPEFGAERLLGWLEQLKPKGRRQLDLACLAFELGEAHRARQLMAGVGPLPAQEQDRLKRLLWLADMSR